MSRRGRVHGNRLPRNSAGKGPYEICELCGMPAPVHLMFEGETEGLRGLLICHQHGNYVHSLSYNDHRALNPFDIPENLDIREPPLGMEPWWPSTLPEESED